MSYTIDGFFHNLIEKFSDVSLNTIYGKWKNSKMYVGPIKDSDQWWSSTKQDQQGWITDTFEFTRNNKLIINHNGQTWTETWQRQGVDNIDTTTEGISNPIAPFVDGTFDFELLNNNQVKVKGIGAYISLPKAYNGGEITNAKTLSERTYEYQFVDNDKIKFYMNFGPGIWTFELTRVNDQHKMKN